MMDAVVPGMYVRPMSGHIGAEITGVDLSGPLDSSVVSTIRSGLLRWKVVFFRGQHLDHAAHLAFASRFGEPISLSSRGTASPVQFPQVESTADRRELAGLYELGPAEWPERRRYSVLRGLHSDHTPRGGPPPPANFPSPAVPPCCGAAPPCAPPAP